MKSNADSSPTSSFHSSLPPPPPPGMHCTVLGLPSSCSTFYIGIIRLQTWQISILLAFQSSACGASDKMGAARAIIGHRIPTSETHIGASAGTSTNFHQARRGVSATNLNIQTLGGWRSPSIAQEPHLSQEAFYNKTCLWLVCKKLPKILIYHLPTSGST